MADIQPKFGSSITKTKGTLPRRLGDLRIFSDNPGVFANDSDLLTSNAAKYRYACIISFLSAWREACTPINCFSGAKAIGLYPYNPEAPRNSVYVRDLRPDEQQRFAERERRNQGRFNINCAELTDVQMIISLATHPVISLKFPFLCDLNKYIGMNYGAIISDFKFHSQDCKLLTRLPLFHPVNGSPIRFD